jgi:hypothetical protein
MCFFSGNDLTPVPPIVARARDILSASKPTEVSGVVDAVCEAYSGELNLTAERSVLRKYGLKMASVATSKPAMCGHFKTGHMKRRSGQGFLLLQS